MGCDSLSNYYLWPIEYSRMKRKKMTKRLWFAFELLSLTYWIQFPMHYLLKELRCDSLSNYYLWPIEYSFNVALILRLWLWFAFELLSLTYWIQSYAIFLWSTTCCDSLSNYYLWPIEYSFKTLLSVLAALGFALEQVALTLLIQCATFLYKGYNVFALSRTRIFYLLN